MPRWTPWGGRWRPRGRAGGRWRWCSARSGLGRRRVAGAALAAPGCTGYRGWYRPRHGSHPAFGGITVDDFEAQSETFLHTTQHPTLGRPYLKCAYVPMIELLAYLEANGFSNYIASGGGRDFMRPISHEVYGITRERVIGSATALEYVTDERGGAIIRRPEADYLDDGRQKPIRIWTRAGRRPLLAAGNSNGDIPMLEFTRHQDRPFLPLLVLHDDARPRVRLHRRCRAGAGARGRKRLDGDQHQARLGHRLPGLDASPAGAAGPCGATLMLRGRSGHAALNQRCSCRGRPAVVTDDVRAAAIADGCEGGAIVSRPARPGSVGIGSPRA
jgi:hypothetical protein